jgi:hypothetical protein
MPWGFTSAKFTGLDTIRNFIRIDKGHHAVRSIKCTYPNFTASRSNHDVSTIPACFTWPIPLEGNDAHPDHKDNQEYPGRFLKCFL